MWIALDLSCHCSRDVLWLFKMGVVLFMLYFIENVYKSHLYQTYIYIYVYLMTHIYI